MHYRTLKKQILKGKIRRRTDYFMKQNAPQARLVKKNAP